tara:strand:+ start:4698 stop:5288 length:591 start_codon:yes stop_codon:yes gene_type:complete
MSLAVLKRKAATKYPAKSCRCPSGANAEPCKCYGDGTCKYRSFSSKGFSLHGTISVKNHHGSMATRHKWMKRGYPHFVVKDTNPLDYDLYVSRKSQQSGGQNFAEPGDAVSCDAFGSSSCSGPNKYVNVVKKLDVLPQSEYMRTKLMKKNCLPPPLSKQPCPVARSGPCNSCSSGVDPCGDGVEQHTGVENGACES